MDAFIQKIGIRLASRCKSSINQKSESLNHPFVESRLVTFGTSFKVFSISVGCNFHLSIPECSDGSDPGGKRLKSMQPSPFFLSLYRGKFGSRKTKEGLKILSLVLSISKRKW